jgi:hypothetical protein
MQTANTCPTMLKSVMSLDSGRQFRAFQFGRVAHGYQLNTTTHGPGSTHQPGDRPHPLVYGMRGIVVPVVSRLTHLVSYLIIRSGRAGTWVLLFVVP